MKHPSGVPNSPSQPLSTHNRTQHTHRVPLAEHLRKTLAGESLLLSDAHRIRLELTEPLSPDSSTAFPQGFR